MPHKTNFNLTFPLFLVFLAASLCGCGSYVAHRMVQAPNTYPTWLAPRAPVILSFNELFFTNMPAQHVELCSPPALLHYRIVEPMEYHFKVTSTNWLDHG